MKLVEMERGSTPKVKVTYIPILCMHCSDAPCIEACKVKAIYRRDDGIVIINPEKCTGCRDCVYVCPYEAIYFNWDLNIAQKCTMCAHLLDKGWKEPRCVDACPTDALKFIDEEELNIKERIEVVDSEKAPYIGLPKRNIQTKPRVYYIGLPKRFIAGSVYDPEDDECIEGATVTVMSEETKEIYATKTDNYGDFWIHGLKIGVYTVTVEKENYFPKEIKNVSTEKDVNLGDIAIYKKKA
jgi:Fe-S-cluster-containing dehydrogenase component